MPVHDNSPRCNCYVTDGPTAGVYQNYRFFDFRSIAKASQYSIKPSNVTETEDKGKELSQEGYIRSKAFQRDWELQSWGHEATASRPTKRQNSPRNVYIATKDEDSSQTNLVLRTSNNGAFSSCGEMKSKETALLHASIRVRARLWGASGAVAGIFTYLNDTVESDIEILTRNSIDQIWYTNQPHEDSNGKTIPGAATQVDMPDGAVWTDWNVHRLDWLPEISGFYLNGKMVLNKTYGVPKVASYFTLNMWNDGGDWSGELLKGNAAYLEIDWIEMVYNTSSTRSGESCVVPCRVDGVQKVGFPEGLGLALLPSKWAKFLAIGVLILATVM